MDHETWTDGELIRRFLAAADQDAFRELVRRHIAMVRRTIARICVNGDLDDLVQTVFLTLARKANVLRTRVSLAGWLHYTAYNLALRWRRNQQRRVHHELSAATARNDVQDGADLHPDQVELYERLCWELDRLPEAYRDALVLHHIEGYTIEQTAHQLAARPGTVAARLSRGREILRRRLSDAGFAVTGSLFILAFQPAAPIAPPATVRIEAIVERAALLATPPGTVCAAMARAGIPLMGSLKVALLSVSMLVTSVAAGSVILRQAFPPASRTGGLESNNVRVTLPQWRVERNEAMIPEPATLPLLGAATLLLLRRSRGAPSASTNG